jgi:hypothetical protein
MRLLWHYRNCNGNLWNSLVALGWVPPRRMPALHAAHLMLGTAASHGPWQSLPNNVHAFIYLVHAQIPAACLMRASLQRCPTLDLHRHQRLSSHTNGLIPAAACFSMRGKSLLQSYFVFLQFCLSILVPSRLSLQEGTALVRFERHAERLRLHGCVIERTFTAWTSGLRRTLTRLLLHGLSPESRACSRACSIKWK